MIRKSHLIKKAGEKEALMLSKDLEDSLKRLQESTSQERRYFNVGNELKSIIPNLKKVVEDNVSGPIQIWRDSPILTARQVKDLILNDPEGVIKLTEKAQKDLEIYDNMPLMFDAVKKIEILLEKIKSSEYLKKYKKDFSGKGNNVSDSDFYFKDGFDWPEFAYWVRWSIDNFDLNNRNTRDKFSSFSATALEWHTKLKTWIPKSNDQGFPSFYSAEIEQLIFQTFDKFMGNSRVEGISDLKDYYDTWQEKRNMTDAEERQLARYEGIPLDGVAEWVTDNYEKPYEYTLKDVYKYWSRLKIVLGDEDEKIYPMVSLGRWKMNAGMTEKAKASALATLKSV